MINENTLFHCYIVSLPVQAKKSANQTIAIYEI